MKARASHRAAWVAIVIVLGSACVQEEGRRHKNRDHDPSGQGGGGGSGGAGVPLLCGDTCQWAADGVCDDGGPGAAYLDCEYGSDCTDCGPRPDDGSSTTTVTVGGSTTVTVGSGPSTTSGGPECAGIGDDCTTHSDCCPGDSLLLCANESTGSHCCVASGAACSSDSECCEGYSCVLGSNGYDICFPL
jgi:hypothetical protein